jgi:hypothetical protein
MDTLLETSWNLEKTDTWNPVKQNSPLSFLSPSVTDLFSLFPCWSHKPLLSSLASQFIINNNTHHGSGRIKLISPSSASAVGILGPPALISSIRENVNCHVLEKHDRDLHLGGWNGKELTNVEADHPLILLL